MKTLFVGLLGGVLLLSGCKSAAPHAESQTNPPSLPNGSIAARNNCYSLLYDLMKDEKDVSILRFIKREDPQLKELIKRVATTAKAAEKQLQLFAKEDPSVQLNDLALPAGEVKTRDAIGKTKQEQLLHTSGERFALNLLLTQTDALSYGAHLAKVAAQLESNPTRAHYLTDLSNTLINQHEEVVSRLALTSPPSAPETKYFDKK